MASDCHKAALEEANEVETVLTGQKHWRRSKNIQKSIKTQNHQHVWRETMFATQWFKHFG
jgi:hypothetical protein